MTNGSKQAARSPPARQGIAQTTPRPSSWKSLRHRMNPLGDLTKLFHIPLLNHRLPMAPRLRTTDPQSIAQVIQFNTLILQMRKLLLIDYLIDITQTMRRRRCRPYQPPSLLQAPVGLQPSTMDTTPHSQVIQACLLMVSPGF